MSKTILKTNNPITFAMKIDCGKWLATQMACDFSPIWLKVSTIKVGQLKKKVASENKKKEQCTKGF